MRIQNVRKKFDLTACRSPSQIVAVSEGPMLHTSKPLPEHCRSFGVNKPSYYCLHPGG